MVIRIAPSDADQPASPRGKRLRTLVQQADQPLWARRIIAVLRRIPFAILLAALPFLVAWAAIKLLPVRYSATVSLYNATEPAATLSPQSSAVLVARSYPVLERVLADSNLRRDVSDATAETIAAQISGIVDRIRGQQGKNSQPDVAGLQNLVRATTTEVNVTDITVSAATPDGAVRLATAVAANTIDALGASQRAPDARGEALRTRLTDAELALQRYRSQSKPQATSDRSQRRAELSRRATERKARYDQIQAAISSGKDIEAVAESLRSPATDRLRAQLKEARAKEANLKATRSTAVAEATAEVDEKLKLLAESVRLAAAAARADAQILASAAQSGEEPLPGALTDADPAAADLERNVSEARQAYADYLKAAGLPTNTARVVREATATSVSGLKPAWAWIAAALTALVLCLITFERAWRSVRPQLAHIGPNVRAAPAKPVGDPPDYPAPPQETPPPAPPVPPMRATEPHATADSDAEEPDKHAASQAAQALVLRRIALDISEVGWSRALQTVLVTGQDAASVSDATIAISTDLARQNMRVLVIDADETAPNLSRLLRDAPVSGYLTLYGKRRMLSSFEPNTGAPVWFVPAEAALKTTPPVEGAMVVPSITGNFDVMMIAGPLSDAQAHQALANAADRVVSVGPPAGGAHGIAADKLEMVPPGPSSRAGEGVLKL